MGSPGTEQAECTSSVVPEIQPAPPLSACGSTTWKNRTMSTRSFRDPVGVQSSLLKQCSFMGFWKSLVCLQDNSAKKPQSYIPALAKV